MRWILGNRRWCREIAEGARVHFAQEVDCLQVLPPAMDVRDPLVGLAAVIEVEHGGHCIDAQRIDVEALQPEQGVGDQEVADLRRPKL
jgi:hypothetical protein